MKKLLGALCILLSLGLLTNQAQAQVDFGIRGGVNFATFNNVDDFETESRTGVMAGVYINYQIPNSPISIQPEILYTQKGAMVTVLSDTDTPIQFEYKLNYIAIPVLAKFDYVLDGPVTPHVYFGPYVAFTINAEAQYEGQNGSITADISDKVKNTDFGVVVGAGVDVSRFNIGVRYSVGLVTVAEDDDEDNIVNAVEAKNGVISIVAGFTF